MTNVPQIIRDLWTDLYKLFDRNYMIPNTEEAWGKFWEEARQIDEKYHGCPYLPKAFDLVTAMIEARIIRRGRQMLAGKGPPLGLGKFRNVGSAP